MIWKLTKWKVEDQLARWSEVLDLGSVTLGGVKPEVTALAIVETERLDSGTGVAGGQALAIERLVIGAEFEAERLGLNVVLSRGEASNGCEEDDGELHREGCWWRWCWRGTLRDEEAW